MKLTIEIDANLVNGIIQTLYDQLVAQTKSTDKSVWAKQQPALYHQYSELTEIYMKAL